MADMFDSSMITDSDDILEERPNLYVTLNGRDKHHLSIHVKSDLDSADVYPLTISFSDEHFGEDIDDFISRVNDYYLENPQLRKDVDYLLTNLDNDYTDEYQSCSERVQLNFRHIFSDVEKSFFDDRKMPSSKPEVANDFVEASDGSKIYGSNGLVALTGIDDNVLHLEFKSSVDDVEAFRHDYPLNLSVIDSIGIDKFVSTLATSYESDSSLTSAVKDFHDVYLNVDQNLIIPEDKEFEADMLHTRFEGLANTVNNELLPDIEKMEETRHREQVVRNLLGDGIDLSDDEKALIDTKVVVHPILFDGDEPLKIPTRGYYDFESFENHQLTLTLNYNEDGHCYKGVPVTFRGVSSQAQCESLMLRVNSLMEDNGYLVSQFIEQYVHTAKDMADDEEAKHLHDVSSDLLSASLFTLSSKLDKEKLLRNQFDVVPEQVDNLITMDIDGERDENGNIYPDRPLKSVSYSFNYVGEDGKFYKGISVDASHCFDFTQDAQHVYEEASVFYQRLHDEYTKVDINGHLDRIKSWCVGWDKAGIEKSEFMKYPRGNVEYFEQEMFKQRTDIVEQFDKFVQHTQDTLVLETKDNSLSAAYGTSEHLMDVISMDNESFTVRLNHKHNPLGLEDVPIRTGVEYTFSWYGADSVTNEQKAKFLGLLEQELSSNDDLQKEIWEYNMRRALNHDERNSVNVATESDENSKTLSTFLHDFERNLKYNLHSIRQKQAAFHDSEIRKLSALAEQVSQAMADEVEFLRAKGPLGRLKMRLFHQSEYQKHRQHILELQKQDEEIKQNEVFLVDDKGFSPRTKELLAAVNENFKSVEPDVWRVKLEEALARDVDFEKVQADVLHKSDKVFDIFHVPDSKHAEPLEKSGVSLEDDSEDYSVFFDMDDMPKHESHKRMSR